MATIPDMDIIEINCYADNTDVLQLEDVGRQFSPSVKGDDPHQDTIAVRMPFASLVVLDGKRVDDLITALTYWRKLHPDTEQEEHD